MLPMNCPHTVDHKKKMVSPLFHPFPLAKTTLVFFIPFSVSLHNNSGLTLWSNIHQEITLCFRRIQPHLHPSIANWINSCKPSPVFFFFFFLCWFVLLAERLVLEAELDHSFHFPEHASLTLLMWYALTTFFKRGKHTALCVYACVSVRTCVRKSLCLYWVTRKKKSSGTVVCSEGCQGEDGNWSTATVYNEMKWNAS